jgi:hypothetical protein
MFEEPQYYGKWFKGCGVTILVSNETVRRKNVFNKSILSFASFLKGRLVAGDALVRSTGNERSNRL